MVPPTSRRMETQPAPPASPPTAPAQPQDQPETESSKRRHNGFVARKPKEVREKINLMLEDGVPYRKIIENLAEDGQGLSEDCIRSWKHGGFKEWLVTLQQADALASTREAALHLLKEKAGEPAQDAARTVVAAQLYELLLSFNPTSFAAALAEKPDLYLGLVNALARLCECEAVSNHRRAQQAALASKLPANQTTPDKKLLSAGDLKDITREIKLI